ncbi:MAG: GspE/PulE family protein [Patescibacteria group bacterium]|nr:GspE/PulE family protein [Patescibacteria group bacterium]
MNLPLETLKKIIVGSGFVTEQSFDDVVKSALEIGKDPIDTLVFHGLINEDTVGRLIADYYKVNYIVLKRIKIDKEVLDLIPEKMVRLYRMIPFEKEESKLKLAMENPEDFEALEFAKRVTGLSIEVYYARKEDMDRAYGQYQKGIEEDFEKIIKENVQKTGEISTDDLVKAAEKLPIVKILESIISYAISEKASDIHIETQAEEVIVRYRIDGVLRDVIKLPRGVEAALVARVKILSNLKIDEHRVPQDGRHKFNAGGNEVSLRISIIPGFYGENVVMRLLAESSRPLSLEELGLTGRNLDLIKESIDRPHGMILVTGPTGSGKTTTLYSVLNILNTVDVKICTIEDPVEYGMNRVTQIQVNTKTGLDFASGLRALLRHDPDIIMVGEIRDQETAEIAIHAALTGHRVLSTLHTNTAAGAIPRFIDMGAEGFLLASTLNVIVAQRLVRKLCSNCVMKYNPPSDLVKKLSKELNIDLTAQKFYKGKGCSLCGGKGYVGRIGIYEVLPVTEKVRTLIAKKSTSDEIQKEAVREGMITMLQDGIDKVASGLTSLEEVLRVVRES